MQVSEPVNPWFFLLLTICGAGLGAAVAGFFLFGRPRPPASSQLASSVIVPPVPSESRAVIHAPPAPPAGSALGAVLGALFLIALIGAALSSKKERRHDE